MISETLCFKMTIKMEWSLKHRVTETTESFLELFFAIRFEHIGLFLLDLVVITEMWQFSRACASCWAAFDDNYFGKSFAYRVSKAGTSFGTM